MSLNKENCTVLELPLDCEPSAQFYCINHETNKAVCYWLVESTNDLKTTFCSFFYVDYLTINPEGNPRPVINSYCWLHNTKQRYCSSKRIITVSNAKNITKIFGVYTRQWAC